MNAEIELKLFFLPEFKKSLINELDSLEGSSPLGIRRLTNGYFDTPALQLRHWDMGLRVRGCDGVKEQTLKTAGQVVAGVHYRPEYNVSIQADNPDLSLFPANIWALNADVSAVQAELACVFHTDFNRHAWQVTLGDSVVEVALDIGQIRANDQQEALCELECELLSGDVNALIALATQVASRIPVRLGKASKAQRGYRLAGQSTPLNLSALEFLPLPVLDDLNLHQSHQQDPTKACLVLLETALERWQLLEAMIAQEQDHEARLALWWRMRACIRLLRMTLSQFTLANTTLMQRFRLIESQLAFIEDAQALAALLGSQKGLLSRLDSRQALMQHLQQQFEAMDVTGRLTSLWQSIEYGQLQLAIVEILFALNAGDIELPAELGLSHYANYAQETPWRTLLAAMPSAMTTEDYVQCAAMLDESMQAGQAYGLLYGATSRDAFRASWQDLALGIKTLACYQQLTLAAQTLGIDLNDWLGVQRQDLLFAMEASRQNAMQQTTYW